MIEKVKERVRGISASVALGVSLLAVGLGLIVVSLAFHMSLFAMVLTWVLYFSAGIGGWLIGLGSKK